MSLLSICQAVTAETGWPVPSAIAANSEGTAVQLKALANAELEHLSEQHDWPHTEVEYTFNTVIGTTVYELPENYRKMVFGSLYNAAQYYQLRGSMNPEEWMRRKYGLLGSISRQTCRVIVQTNGRYALEVTPTPSSAEQVVFFYQGNQYAKTEAGVRQSKYEGDTDTSLIPERLVQLGLKWRFRRAKGLDFSAELAEYNSVVSQQFVARQMPQDIPVGGRRYGYDELGSGYVPDNGYGL